MYIIRYVTFTNRLKIPKGVIRSRKSKGDRKYNGQKKKNDLQNTTQTK